MHKQHEDQPSNELPNLSTWHRVPTGAVIPKNTPCAYAYGGYLTVQFDGYSRNITVGRGGYSYYTEHPIAPPLPTEEGATIVVSGSEKPPHILLTRVGRMCVGGCWLDRYGNEWPVEKIRAWAPVTIGEVVVMP